MPCCQHSILSSLANVRKGQLLFGELAGGGDRLSPINPACRVFLARTGVHTASKKVKWEQHQHGSRGYGSKQAASGRTGSSQRKVDALV